MFVDAVKFYVASSPVGGRSKSFRGRSKRGEHIGSVSQGAVERKEGDGSSSVSRSITRNNAELWKY
ncbi:hypothetical protein AVEN_275758-1, partial [Araneus ventricosus]